VADFPKAAIMINSGSLMWGPFAFSFGPGVPPGDTVASVVVTSEAPDGSNSTSALISPGSVAVVGNAVQLRLQFPAASIMGEHKLFFEVTFASGAEQRFEFDYVVVET
jgi:hypothetical protein